MNFIPLAENQTGAEGEKTDRSVPQW